MKKKKLKRKRELDKLFEEELFESLSGGNTLQEVAYELNYRYSDLIAKINSHPKYIDCLKDGKEAGKAYWIRKLKKYMTNKTANSMPIKLFYGNYMDWWSSPLPSEDVENTTVIIKVIPLKMNKMEQKAYDER